MLRKEREYVVYGKFIGRTSFSIIFRHIFPAVLPTLIVAASASISGAIMTESALSFWEWESNSQWLLGGVCCKMPKAVLQRAPYMAILPGLFVIFTIYSFNNLGT